MSSIDRIVFQTRSVRAGAFRCAVTDSRFRNTGPTEGHIVVFPRTAVWIRHAGSRAFVADPGVITIYNRGQEYTRAPLAADGDRSDWFGVSPELALAVSREFDPRADDRPERPFRAEWIVCDSSLYLRQRALFRRMERGEVEQLEGEESVLSLVAAVMQRALGSPDPSLGGRRAAQARLDLAQRARAELARSPAAPTDLATLARSLDTSPFHLCRVFRAAHGRTLHEYRLELRLRMALERLGEPGTDISRLAFELGFSSHSHFTHTFRARMGRPPSALRPGMLPSRFTG